MRKLLICLALAVLAASCGSDGTSMCSAAGAIAVTRASSASEGRGPLTSAGREKRANSAAST